MGLQYRGKLLFLIVGLLSVIVTVLSGFFLNLFNHDKVNGLLAGERANMARFSEHLGSLLNLATLLEPANVRQSKEIIFVQENPCDPTVRKPPVLSDAYAEVFRDLELAPEDWATSLAAFEACKKLRAQESSAAEIAVVLSDGPSLPVPYAAFLFGKPERLVAISMEGFQTSAQSTLSLVSRRKEKTERIWGDDSTEFFGQALSDTGVGSEQVMSIVDRVLKDGAPLSERAGRDGLLAVAPINSQWALVSLSYFPALVRPVTHAFFQFLFFALGFILIAVLLGRRAAAIVTEPLVRLNATCERIGQGDLQAASSLPSSSVGGDEITRVQATVATMAGKISRLLEDVKAKADLESELRVAKEVQTMLLPAANVQNPFLGLASVVQFAAQCGGDWWGVLDAKSADENPVTILMVGDVTDHGVPSALITAAVRGGLSVIANWVESNPEHAINPCWVLNHLNRAVCDSAKGRLSMTFFIAAFLHQSAKVRCANAGHPFPYLIRPGEKGAKATLKNITVSGNPLGDKITNVYEDFEELDWTKGSRLFIYSDGIIDPGVANEADAYGRKQLRKTIQTAASMGGQGLLNRVMDERKKLMAKFPQPDDITLVIADAKA